jgi:ribosomal protein L11 methyltransferase
MVLRVEVPPDDAELAADLLWQAGASAVGEEADDATGTVRLTADLDEPPPSVLTARVGRRWAVETWVDDGSWADGWRLWARAVAAGPFWVRPPWIEAPTPAGLVEVVLDGGRAFGTGSHPSTTLALAALADAVRPGASVLDVGCGSGALAIGAALLGAAPVVALDPDPEAVGASRANAAVNGVEVEVLAASMEDVRLAHRFDVVVANVGAPLVEDLAGPLLEALAPGGTLVLSGMLAGREAAVARRYPMLASTTTELDGWSALTLSDRRA